MKKFRIGINNPTSEQYFYIESKYDDPIWERGELGATGFVGHWASRKPDMSDKFYVTIAPNHCSYITVEELEE